MGTSPGHSISTRVATWLEFGDTIGVYNIDGTRLAVLDGSLMCCGDYDPVWSPDGADAILVKTSGTNNVLWELPVDGGEPVHLPRSDPRQRLEDGRWLAMPAYSPDGQRVVLIEADLLVTVAADGSSERVLVDYEPRADVESPRWSPTGENIAYLESRALTFDEADNSPGERSWTLRIVDAETGTITASAPIASGRIYLDLAGFSPEGDVLLTVDDEGDGGSTLWLVNADGSNARVIVPGAYHVGWVVRSAQRPTEDGVSP